MAACNDTHIAVRCGDRYKRGLVLLSADLNNLETINAEHGHEPGDRTIVAMAETMRSTTLQELMAAADSLMYSATRKYKTANPSQARS